MDELLKDIYVHIGTDTIYKDLWLDIQMDQICRDSVLKPYGGLWTSLKNNNVCDWLDYRNVDLEYLEYVNGKKGCYVKFREDSKLLVIRNSNDFHNLKQSGFVIDISDKPISVPRTFDSVIINQRLDYEKISDNFDLLYLNPTADVSFYNFSVNTMLALTPNSIEYLKPIEIDYFNNRITNIKEKKAVVDYDKNYYKLLEYINSLFYEIPFSDNYDEYIKKLYTLQKEIEKELQLKKDKIGSYFDKKININHLIHVLVLNIYKQKYQEKSGEMVKRLTKY